MYKRKFYSDIKVSQNSTWIVVSLFSSEIYSYINSYGGIGACEWRLLSLGKYAWGLYPWQGPVCVSYMMVKTCAPNCANELDWPSFMCPEKVEKGLGDLFFGRWYFFPLDLLTLSVLSVCREGLSGVPTVPTETIESPKWKSWKKTFSQFFSWLVQAAGISHPPLYE